MPATLEPRTGGRVNRETGIITGVKVIGPTSANRRTYSRTALETIARLCEGVAVNVDHVEPGQRRSYKDRIGRLTNPRVGSDGVYADLIVNTAHPLAEQIFNDAEFSPGSLGLSIDARGNERAGVVESVDKLVSVDLVANPATTRGLYEDCPGAGKGRSETMRSARLMRYFESRDDAAPEYSPPPSIGADTFERLRGRLDSERAKRAAAENTPRRKIANWGK